MLECLICYHDCMVEEQAKLYLNQNMYMIMQQHVLHRKHVTWHPTQSPKASGFCNLPLLHPSVCNFLLQPSAILFVSYFSLILDSTTFLPKKMKSAAPWLKHRQPWKTALKAAPVSCILKTLDFNIKLTT